MSQPVPSANVMKGAATSPLVLLMTGLVAGGWPLVSQAFTPGPYTDDTNTVALYHLDQSSGTSCTDDNSSGRTANPGTFVGSPSPVWSDGLFGGGLSLGNNTQNGVEVPPMQNDYQSYTIEMYLNWAYYYNANPGYIFFSSGNDLLRGFIYDHGNNPLLTPMGIDYVVRTSDGTYHDINTPESMALFAGQWYHVAATRSWDGTTATWSLYVNGALAGSYSSTLSFWASGANLYLGADGGVSGNPSFIGLIDEVRLSNFARTQFGVSPTAPAITSIVRSNNDVYLAWSTLTSLTASTNVVQATSGAVDGSYSSNAFTDVSPVIIVPPGQSSTNYVDVDAATNAPVRYYRVRIVP